MEFLTGRRKIKYRYEDEKLSQVAEINMGQAPEGEHYNDIEDGLPLLAGAADFGDEYPSPKKWSRVAPKQSQVGDILLCIRATIGTLNWSDKSYCLGRGVAGIRPNQDKIVPEYLYGVLEMQKSYMESRGTGSTFKQITSSELAKVPVPLPPLDIQRALVADLDQARTARKAKLAEADDLLKGMDEVVMRELGLKMPSSASPMAFGVRLGDIMKNNRFNADYFHPERTTILQAIHQQYQDNSKSLGDIVEFMRDVVTVTENDSYMGLASVQSHTGERILVDEMAEGQAFQFQTGDVLYGRLRPYLNKVYHAESEGLCSTEFHVMRVIDENMVMSAYIATLLRTKVILNQTKHMMSGNTHPRLTNDDVINLMIPIPPTDTQQRIVGELHTRKERARQLRQEADTIWHEAQARFEQALIG